MLVADHISVWVQLYVYHNVTPLDYTAKVPVDVAIPKDKLVLCERLAVAVEGPSEGDESVERDHYAAVVVAQQVASRSVAPVDYGRQFHAISRLNVVAMYSIFLHKFEDCDAQATLVVVKQSEVLVNSFLRPVYSSHSDNACKILAASMLNMGQAVALGRNDQEA